MASKKGLGSVTYDKKRRKYQARPYIKGMGRLASKMVLTENEGWAYCRDEVARVLGRDYGRGEYAPAQRVTMEEQATVAVRRSRLSPLSVKQLKVNLRAACGHIGPDRLVTSVTRGEVDEYAAVLHASGLHGSTQRGRLNALRKLFDSAVADGLRPDNPAMGVAVVAHDAERPQRFVSTDEFASIASEVPGWARPAFYIARTSGLRIAELAGLHGRSLALDGEDGYGTVAVSHVWTAQGYRPWTKNKSTRTGVLWPETVRLLRTHRLRYGWRDEDPVFVNPRTDRPASPWNLRDTWNRACEAAGVADPPRVHDLRHSYAIDLRDMGATPDFIADALGHKDVRTVRIYTGARTVEAMAQWMKDRHVG